VHKPVLSKICDNCGKTFRTTSKKRDWCNFKCKNELDQLEKTRLRLKKLEQIKPKHIIYYPINARLTNKIKNIILERDNFECQICGISEELYVCWIGDKRNLHPDKLVSLCHKCGNKKLYITDKEYWQIFLKEKIKQNPRNKNIKVIRKVKNETNI